MKKLVPDPPVLCIAPGLSHDEAIRKAEEHLSKALGTITYLPVPASLKHQGMLSGVVLDMQICRALLTVALAKSTVAVPV